MKLSVLIVIVTNLMHEGYQWKDQTLTKSSNIGLIEKTLADIAGINAKLIVGTEISAVSTSSQNKGRES